MKNSTGCLRMVLTSIAFLLAFGLQGQSKYLNFGGGVNLTALRDQAYSPLGYSGIGSEGFLGFHSLGERKETIWLLSAGISSLSSEFDRGLNTIGVRLLNLNLYHQPDVESGFQWGWANNNGFYHRNIDGFQNFNGRVDFFTSFGPAGNYRKHFKIREQRFKFQTAAHIQLIGIYLPSGYVASLPSGFGYEPNNFLGGVVDSMRIFYPGSAFNAALWPRLDWQLGTGNGVSLNYLYEYSQFSNPHRSVRSSGHWFLTFNMLLR